MPFTFFLISLARTFNTILSWCCDSRHPCLITEPSGKEFSLSPGFLKCYVLLYLPSHAWLCATPWTVAHQASLSMGIFQARELWWVAMPSSRGFSQPRGWTQVSHIAGRFFTVWATREALNKVRFFIYYSYFLRQDCMWYKLTTNCFCCIP